MPHPTQQVSKSVISLIKRSSRVIKRAHSHLLQSVIRYREALEEIEDISAVTLPNELDRWPVYEKILIGWKQTLKKENLSFDKDTLLNCLNNIWDISQEISQAWESLRISLKKMTDNSDLEICAERIISESGFIKNQLLLDILDCKRKHLFIVENLEKLGIIEFHFQMARQRLQLKKNTFTNEHPTEGILGVEWIGLDLSALSREKLNLENCAFIECNLGEPPWKNAFWSNVQLYNCIGSLVINNSEVSVSIIDSALLSISIYKSRGALRVCNTNFDKLSISDNSSIKTLNVSGIKCKRIDIKSNSHIQFAIKNSRCETINLSQKRKNKNGHTINIENSAIKLMRIGKSFISSLECIQHSSLSLFIDNGNINKMLVRQSKCLMTAYRSSFHALNGIEARMYMHICRSQVQKQTWNRSNAWIINENPCSKRDVIFTVTHGVYEHHQISHSLKCWMVFDNPCLSLFDGLKAASYARIGRIASTMKIQTCATNDIMGHSLLNFYQSQFFWLLSKKHSAMGSYLCSAIESRPALKCVSHKLTPHMVMMLFFQKKVFTQLSAKPIISGKRASKLNADESAFMVDLLRHEENTDSDTSVLATDFDACFCRYLLESLTKIDHLIELSLQNSIFSIVQSHLDLQPINLELIAKIAERLTKARISHRQSTLKCRGFVINHLLQMCAWYLDLRVKADDFVMNLSDLFARHQEKIDSHTHYRRTYNELIEKPSLLSAQSIIREHKRFKESPETEKVVNSLAHEYAGLVSQKKYQALKESSILDEYRQLMLDSTFKALQSYHPLFFFFPRSRKKKNVIRELIKITKGASLPMTKARSLYLAINQLLTPDGTQQEPPTLFERFSYLSLGRSRGANGYLTVLNLARHMLKRLVEYTNFHSPCDATCNATRVYFNSSGGNTTEIKRLISYKARQKLTSHLKEFKQALKQHHAHIDLSVCIRASDNIDLDGQLKISCSLMETLDQAKDWTKADIKQLALLWYCYEVRENKSIQKILRVSLKKGSFIKHYTQPRVIRTQQSVASADSSLTNEVVIEKSHEQHVIDVFRALRQSARSRQHIDLFAVRAKQALREIKKGKTYAEAKLL